MTLDGSLGYQCKVIADSINPDGNRLTTIEATYPMIVHKHMLTHRVFSRNSSSARAIPTEKLLQRVLDNPAMPLWWGKNQAGMQAREEISAEEKEEAITDCLRSRDEAVRLVRKLAALGVHKETVNRYVEPWMWITTIISATEYQNFFKQRCHPDAQGETKKIACMMREAYTKSQPSKSRIWHMPYLTDEDYLGYDIDDLLKLSVARCARVSYLNHDGQHDPVKDIGVFKRLETRGDWSPFEHVARRSSNTVKSGNFTGWVQLREQAECEPMVI